MATRDPEHPLSSLLTAIVNEITHLFQTEFRLARAEVSENINRVSYAGMMIGAGAVLILPGLVVLLLAIVRWLVVAGMPQEWGLTLVGVVVLAIGAGLAIAGVNAVRSASLVPERTLHQVQADFSVAKGEVR
jgi:uncharacterized membrane protein YqjE